VNSNQQLLYSILNNPNALSNQQLLYSILNNPNALSNQQLLYSILNNPNALSCLGRVTMLQASLALRAEASLPF